VGAEGREREVNFDTDYLPLLIGLQKHRRALCRFVRKYDDSMEWSMRWFAGEDGE